MSQGHINSGNPHYFLWIILPVDARLILTVLQMFQNSYYYVGVLPFCRPRELFCQVWQKYKVDILKEQFRRHQR
jgi:hypothetical protein